MVGQKLSVAKLRDLTYSGSRVEKPRSLSVCSSYTWVNADNLLLLVHYTIPVACDDSFIAISLQATAVEARLKLAITFPGILRFATLRERYSYF